MGKSKRRKSNSGNPAKATTDEQAIWVKTERALDGRWMTTVEFDQDKAIALDPDEVHAYSTAILTACAHAEYDAAVLNQLMKRVREPAHAIATVQELRRDRPEVQAVKGWTFTGGVSQKTRKGFVILAHDGEDHSQIDLEPARGHAMHVLDALIVADLDAGYMTHLRSAIGLEEDVAMAVVNNLGVHR